MLIKHTSTVWSERAVIDPMGEPDEVRILCRHHVQPWSGWSCLTEETADLLAVFGALNLDDDIETSYRLTMKFVRSDSETMSNSALLVVKHAAWRRNHRSRRDQTVDAPEEAFWSDHATYQRTAAVSASASASAGSPLGQTRIHLFGIEPQYSVDLTRHESEGE
jgi:hypothetical protein